MTAAITLRDIMIDPVVEQQVPFFDPLEFFSTCTSSRSARLRLCRERKVLIGERIQLGSFARGRGAGSVSTRATCYKTVLL
jgi:hypothetical protein